MTDEKVEFLSAPEYTSISQMLWELIEKCPYLDGLVPEFENLGTKKSIGIFILPPPVTRIIKYNVQGGFSAQIGFEVQYRCFPASSQLRIDNQAYLDRIMGWLTETRELPRLSDDREITKITVSTSIPHPEEVGKDKSVIYAADAVMEYEKE